MSERLSSSVQVMQRIRLKRFSILCGGVLVYLLLWSTLLAMDFGPVSTAGMVALWVFAVVGSLLFLAFIYFELNLSFSDPDFALVQMIWAVTIVICSAWLAADMRTVLLVTGFALILTGTHRLDHKDLYRFGGVVVVIYGSLFVLDYIGKSNFAGWAPETMEFMVIIVVVFAAPFLLHAEKSVMQSELANGNQQLGNALQRIDQLSSRDELTGAFNLRHLSNVLAHEKAMADRSNYVFSICFIDLDYFKRVNALFGRHTGDSLLKNFVQTLETVVRAVDCVARVGGEEFVLVLGGTTEVDALVVAQRLRSLLQGLAVTPSAPDHRITASIGISQYRGEESYEVTLKRAALCLHGTRRTGRDHIIVADAELETSIAG